MSEVDTTAMELMTEGLKFPEGPVALADGTVLVVEIEGNSVAHIAADGALIRRFAVGRGPNGMALGPDGAAYVCCDGGLHFTTDEDGIRFPDAIGEDYEGGEVQRLDLVTGEVTTAFTHIGEARITSLNDIVFDHTGSAYVVDTGLGKIYYADPVRGTGVVAADGLITPNGFGLSPDGTVAYVSETFSGNLYRFDVTAPGKLDNQALHFSTGGAHGFDGLCVDGAGNVCVAGLAASGIVVISPTGEKLGVAPVPWRDTYVTNMCFGGADLRTAYVCSSGRGRLYRLRWPYPGLDVHYSGR